MIFNLYTYTTRILIHYTTHIQYTYTTATYTGFRTPRIHPRTKYYASLIMLISRSPSIIGYYGLWTASIRFFVQTLIGFRGNPNYCDRFSCYIFRVLFPYFYLSDQLNLKRKYRVLELSIEW